MMTASTNGERILHTVNRFYEETPFPGFDLAKYRTKDDLVRQASWWAHKLDAEIPFDADVIDVGCGTGQLARLLGHKGRRVVGVDYSQHSLDLATSLRDKFHLSNVRFQRENILELSLPDGSFDYVFCNGVLHHTSDPYGGFQHLVRIARPGAFLLVGMENDPEKVRTWWADQYEHPHESTHTVDEVLGWFARNGVSYVSSFPKAELLSSSEIEKVFRPRRAGAPG